MQYVLNPTTGLLDLVNDDGGSGAPTGPAGGDLGGTYPNPEVVDDSHAHTPATVSGFSLLGHTHPSSDITDFFEAVDDQVAALLVAPAAGLTYTYNDLAGTLTTALANDLAALEGLAGTGYARRTGVDTWVLDAAAVPAAHTHMQADITDWPLILARGGTNADLSATGGASQVLRQSSAGAAITVSQLAFSDISGSVTDAQVPDTITLANLTQITTRSHASLQSLVAPADDHTQYLHLSGRPGITNNPTISSDGTGAIFGSAVAGGDLFIFNSSTTTFPAYIQLQSAYNIGLFSQFITFAAENGTAAVTEWHDSAELFHSSLKCGDAQGANLEYTWPPSILADGYLRVDADGQLTWSPAVDVTAIHSGDAAGGDLTGTYPNPTLADADLIALRDLAATTGMLSRTAAGAFAARTLTAPAAGISIANPTGAAGNPTFSLANDLAALEGLVGAGFAVRTGTSAWSIRTFGAGTGISITNADGVAGDPLIAFNAADVAAALTRVNDTNVTLTLGGSPTTALLAATSLTLGWTGTLAAARGGTGLAAIGAANTVLNVNSGATALEYDKLVAANVAAATGTTDTFVFATAPSFVTSILTPLIYGGTASSSNLDLQASDDSFLASLTGRIRALSPVSVLAFDTTLDANMMGISIGSGATWTVAGFTAQGVLFNPTVAYGSAPGFGLMPQVFAGQPIFSLDFTGSISPASLYFAGPTYRAETGRTVTVADASIATGGYYDAPTWTRAGTGAYDAAANYAGFSSRFVLAGGASFNLRKGFRVQNAAVSGGGVLALQVGLEVEALTSATTNIGLRNASTWVATPSASQTISVAGNTILANATSVQVSNTTGGSLTLTSAPTIADGQNGQRVRIFSVGTQNVVIQDQGTLAGSNLRLSATAITLAPRDNIELEYNSSIGDWVQVGQVNVL